MATFLPLWWAMAGTALGAVMRLWLTRLLFPFSRNFPVATLLVNVSGGLLAGLAAGISLRAGDTFWPALARWQQGALPLFVSAGLCGGLTTFSLFNLEMLLRPAEQFIMTAVWIVLSLAGWLLAVAIGYRVGRAVGGH